MKVVQLNLGNSTVDDFLNSRTVVSTNGTSRASKNREETTGGPSARVRHDGMTTSRARCLFGIETEYAFSMTPGDDRRTSVATIFRNAAVSTLLHLPASGDGVFLGNGSRFYVDCGTHPEYATPECVNPWDAVRHVLAGDRIVTRLANHVAQSAPAGTKVWLSKCNVDHSGILSTWGCHSSFLYRGKREQVERQLLPHLVSRILYTGAGGWHPISRELQFVLSPRVFHLSHVSGPNSTGERGIFHPRNGPLSEDGSHRLHLMYGESLKSETAMLLSVGTTALVLALIDHGLFPGEAVQLKNPLGALRLFASDPTCRSRATLAGGELATAIEIQRHYLAEVEQHASAAFMPEWAGDICALWKTTLDELADSSPDSVHAKLDWAIKYKVFDQILRESDMDTRGLGRPGIEVSPAIRARLCEADSRFAQLSEPGIFDRLDEAGVLNHRVLDEEDIVHAMTQPPEGSRAALRGRLVKELHGKKSCCCDWMRVYDLGSGRMVKLIDPFIANADWEECTERAYPGSFGARLRNPGGIDHVAELYRRGWYARAADELELLSRRLDTLSLAAQVRFWRYKAWVITRQGFLDGFALLDRTPESIVNFTYVYDRLSVARFQGLVPSPSRMEEWIQKADEMLSADQEHGSGQDDAFHEHKAQYFLALHRIEEALAELKRSESIGGSYNHIAARRAALFGEVYRRLGDRESARVWLRKSREIHQEGRLDGDLADYSLTLRAKLEVNPTVALRWLALARRIQESLRNVVGLTRTMLLQARLTSDVNAAAVWKRCITARRNTYPALQQCERLTHILSRWDEWVGDPRSTEHGDRFWGV